MALPPIPQREAANCFVSLSVSISVGGRFWAFDLARELQKRGHLRRLITSYPRFKAREWGLPNDKVENILSHEFISRGMGLLGLPRSIRRELQVLVHDRFDRLAAERIPPDTQLFTGWSGMSLNCLLRAKSLGAKTVLERGSTHIRTQDRLLADCYRQAGYPWDGIHEGTIACEVEEYRVADLIAVPSQFVRRTFLDEGVPADKLIVNAYGCDLSVFRPGRKQDKVFRVIHCGQISLRKGAHILVQAFLELDLPNSELWMIGAPTSEMKDVLGKVNDSRISVKGPFPQASLPEHYAQGSVFCLATFEEGLAMVIPQALSCGLPVIATWNSGGADVVEDGKTGFLVDAGNVEALKAKLQHLYENEAVRSDMANHARDLRETTGKLSLSWERYGEAMTDSYRKLVHGR